MKKLIFGMILCISLLSIKTYCVPIGVLLLLSFVLPPDSFTSKEKEKAKEIIENDPPPKTTKFTPQEQAKADELKRGLRYK